MNLKPEELVKALRYCSNDYPCKTCPVELQKDESTCIGVLFKHCIDQIERDQKEIAELREKVPQWISVKERLPIDRLKKYLVAFLDAGGPIVDMARYFPSDGWTCDNWDVPQNLITHWMPLPEPPKEDNHEN